MWRKGELKAEQQRGNQVTPAPEEGRAGVQREGRQHVPASLALLGEVTATSIPSALPHRKLKPEEGPLSLSVGVGEVWSGDPHGLLATDAAQL